LRAVVRTRAEEGNDGRDGEIEKIAAPIKAHGWRHGGTRRISVDYGKV
jgi:hypothetical protein